MFESIERFLAPRETILVSGGDSRLVSALGSWGINSGSVIIVCDRIVSELGMTAPYESALRAVGFNVTVFSDIEGEPTLENIELAVAWAHNHKAQLVIGMGGGSALDTAKILAYALADSNAKVQSIRGELPHRKDLPPLVLIPTTTGTGAEATRVAMYSNEGIKVAALSNQFLPLIALLDRDLVAHLPAAVVASTSLDALAHCIESMVSSNRNNLTKTLASNASQIILRVLPEAYHQNSDEARGDLLYASYLAGLSLNAGVVLGHSLSYAIASRQNLSHGAGCALALPYCLAYNHELDDEIQREISVRVLGESGKDFKALAESCRDLTASVGLPTFLAETGLDPESLGDVAEEIVEHFPRANNPIPLEVNPLQTLLRHMYNGDLGSAFEEAYRIKTD